MGGTVIPFCFLVKFIIGIRFSAKPIVLVKNNTLLAKTWKPRISNHTTLWNLRRLPWCLNLYLHILYFCLQGVTSTNVVTAEGYFNSVTAEHNCRPKFTCLTSASRRINLHSETAHTECNSPKQNCASVFQICFPQNVIWQTLNTLPSTLPGSKITPKLHPRHTTGANKMALARSYGASA